MNTVRNIISVFLLLIVVFALLGWHWSVALPPAKMESARWVLGLMIVAAAIAAGVIWSAKPQKSS